MAKLAKSVNVVNLQTTNAAAPTQLAASATVARVLRGFTFVNNTASTITWNFGWNTPAIMAANNSQWFGIQLLAGATFVHFFPGQGARLLGTDAIMAFASAANVSLTVDYDETDLT